MAAERAPLVLHAGQIVVWRVGFVGDEGSRVDAGCGDEKQVSANF